MPEIQGQGESLAAAFRAAVTSVSLGQARPSYTARSPRAQFRQLARTRLGRQALEQAGVTASARTRARWAAGLQQPSRANSEAITRAHAAMRRGGIPDWVRTGQMRISGRVRTGTDERDRGSSGHAPLLVELREAQRPRTRQGDQRSHWEAIDEALAEGADDDDLDELLSDAIAEDIAPSDIWEFPGGGYTVVISG